MGPLASGQGMHTLGSSTSMSETPPPAAPAPTSAPAAAAGYPKILSLIGMIAGIVGIVISIFGGWGFIFSVGAIVLGFFGRSREGAVARPFWLTALITGFVGIALSVIWLIVFIVGFVIFASAGSALYNY